MRKATTLLAIAILPALLLVPAAAGLSVSLKLSTADTDSEPVHPGDVMTTSVGQCTVSFAFDGTGERAGNVYLSTAAHCVDRVGEPVTIGGTAGFATVAYLGDEDDIPNDFAFLLVAPEHASRVQASVRGHPGTPSGVATSDDTSLGDVVLLSGHGLGYSLTATTRESRAGLLYAHNAETYVIEAPILFGDSGGPVVHGASGAALGIVSSIVAGCCAGPGAWNEGPTVDAMLQKAAADGFAVTLRTA